MQKQTSSRISEKAGRLMNLSNDEIYTTVVGPTNMPPASLPHGVGFEQFCDDIRSIAASAVSQDETPGK